MKRVSLYGLVALSILPVVMALGGCSKAEDPKKQAGYYDGPMTPAGGGKTKSGAQ